MLKGSWLRRLPNYVYKSILTKRVFLFDFKARCLSTNFFPSLHKRIKNDMLAVSRVGKRVQSKYVKLGRFVLSMYGRWTTSMNRTFISSMSLSSLLWLLLDDIILKYTQIDSRFFYYPLIHYVIFLAKKRAYSWMKARLRVEIKVVCYMRFYIFNYLDCSHVSMLGFL